MRKKVLIILGGLIVIIFGVYLYCQNTMLQISNYEIMTKNIADFDIAYISDFHNVKSEVLTKRLIEELKNFIPDVIAITGDFIDSNRTDIDVSVDFIRKIKDIAPIYFVGGNHEVKISDVEYSKLREELVKNDVIILDNKVEKIKLEENEINIVGVNDPYFERKSNLSDRDIIKEELSEIEYDPKKYTILLSHRPELFGVYVEKDFDLVLVGHAHGGQFRIPFIGGLIAPDQGFFPKYTSGVFEGGKTSMVVSRGIGNSIVPFRINNRPELVLISLKTM